MKKITTHSKSGLFLMELILALLVLALACTACIRIFAAAYTCRRQAREWNHIQELTISAGEILEGSACSTDAFLALMPDGIAKENTLLYSFDSQWQICPAEEASYSFSVALSVTSGEKQAALKFFNNQGETLYEQTICFPLLNSRKEAA